MVIWNEKNIYPIYFISIFNIDQIAFYSGRTELLPFTIFYISSYQIEVRYFILNDVVILVYSVEK